MSEHSKKPQDQSDSNHSDGLEGFVIDVKMSEFSRDMIENHGLQSILCLYVSDNGDINHCTSWNESKDGALETIADVFVNLIVGDMGDKVLGFIEQQCVLQDRGDHYEKLINRLNDPTRLEMRSLYLPINLVIFRSSKCLIKELCGKVGTSKPIRILIK